MSHLGTRVTALVDGELSPDAAARAHAHAAECAECRFAVEVERATRSALQLAGDPAVPGGLTSSLLSMGGPSGPLPPRPGYVPGTPRPEPLSLPRRPGGRQIGRRLAVAVIGTVSIASVTVLSMLVIGGLLTDAGPALPASTQLTVDRHATVGRPPPAARVPRLSSATPSPSPTTSAPVAAAGMAVHGAQPEPAAGASPEGSPAP